MIAKIVVALAIFLAAFLIWDYMFVDYCSDSGGLWNYREFSCEK